MNRKIVELWHTINGRWYHIIQEYCENGEVRYYTDGKREYPNLTEGTAESKGLSHNTFVARPQTIPRY